MSDDQRIQAILDYWFGELDEYGLCREGQRKLWFASKAATDNHINRYFASDIDDALAGRLQHWPTRPGGLVALVILLDQFTRNRYRGTPQAFEGDPRALALGEAAITSREHLKLPTMHRVFLYMPFEHAEDLSAQEQCVQLFDELLSDCEEPAEQQVQSFRRYAVAHRDVIARFGRFPHRNTICGRQSSTEELQHLETHGGF